MDVRGRLGTRYEDFLRPAPVEMKGASGYFSKPDVGLDPHLFDGMALKGAVRQEILGLLYGFWKGRYAVPRSWSTVWIAGSGASYQWGAEREATGPGDLDILIGVDFQKLRQTNPQFVGFSDDMTAAQMNKEMHDQLWPTTAAHDFGGRSYEVTFYINPQSQDIRDISPYAAYNVSHGSWTVPPIELPGDWGPEKLPTDWWEKFHRDTEYGRQLIDQYNAQAEEVGQHDPGSPHWYNATKALSRTTQQALALFDEIHLGRKAAFLGGGKGFLAFENARWQVGKGSGLIDALRAIKGAHDEASRASRRAMYGGAL
ncbi:MAG TPA: hypothetical protein VFI41_04905 [Gemmatimonadales bacterium]|nr:hypothetical protein [Gemmatimonadales bacterium]